MASRTEACGRSDTTATALNKKRVAADAVSYDGLTVKCQNVLAATTLVFNIREKKEGKKRRENRRKRVTGERQEEMTMKKQNHMQHLGKEVWA